jgi:transposase InsO family protein
MRLRRPLIVRRAYKRSRHVPFPQSTSNEESRVPGEMTHSDVWGPAQTESLHGSRYFISFTDDCTRKCTIEFMKLKSEAGMKVRQYIMQLKTRYSMQPSMIRIDNGTEYINDDLISWCKDQGIEVQRTAPYSPQQNGTAE